MKSRTLLSTIALLILSACAGPGSWLGERRDGGQHQPRESREAAACHGTRCEITVKVRNCVVTVTPYFVVMTNPKPVKMVWQIDGNATFADGGIQWKEPRAAAGVFEPSKESTAKTAVMINGRNAFRMFHYGVAVKEEGGKTCPVLDPTIINDWP